jgi:hypothetical protein
MSGQLPEALFALLSQQESCFDIEKIEIIVSHPEASGVLLVKGLAFGGLFCT